MAPVYAFAAGGDEVTSLERGQLWVMRINALILAVILLLAGSFAEAALARETPLPAGSVLLPLAPLLIYLVFIAPGRRYRAWGYRMEEAELHVRRGVWTQIETIVPLDRVQHIDISQGPLERAFAVCRLVLHTAGTMHSLVLLPGLARPTAERMREDIRARIAQEPE
jgi:uncharacterized protein